MGLFRKMTSIGTLGAVDFRSAKDRTAAHTASIARHTRKQTRIMQAQTHAANVGYVHQFVGQQATPAGWYACPSDPYGSVRYWDGQQWTSSYKP